MDLELNNKLIEINADLKRTIVQTVNGKRSELFGLNSTTDELLEELSINYRELEFQNDELRRTYSVLENTQTELMDLFEGSPVGYIIFNEDFVIDRSNNYFERLVGCGKQTLKNSNLEDLIAPESQDLFYLHLKNLARINENSSCEIEIKHLDVKIPVKVETNYKIKNGVQQFMSAFTNLSVQKKAEESLRESEEKYRFMTENTSDVIWYLDQDYIYQYISPSDEIMRGFVQKEMIGQNFLLNFKPEGLKKIQIANFNIANDKAKHSTANPIYIDLEQRCKDGNWIWTEINIMTIYDSNFQLIGYHGITRNISERKAAEIELEKSRVELKTIYDNAPVMMCLVNKKREILFSNKLFNDFSQISDVDLLIGMPLGLVIGCVNSTVSPMGCGFGPKCNDCVIRQAVENTFYNGKSLQNIEYDAVLENDNGLYNISLLGSTALIDGNVDEKNLLLCLTDITERKQTEKALGESEVKFRLIAENTSDGIMFLANDNKPKYVSPAYLKLLGYSDEVTIARDENDIYNIIHPDDRDVTFKNIFKAIENKVSDFTYIFRVKHSLGHYIWREDHAQFKYDENGIYAGAYVICRDISERKKAEEAQLNSEKRFKTIFNEAPLGIALINSIDGHVYSLNKKFAEIAGRSIEELTQIDWMSNTHPDDLQEVIDNMELINTKKIDSYNTEKRYFLKNGKVVWINMTVAPMVIDNESTSHHLCMIEDITDRKNAAEIIKESQEELKQFAAHLQDVREEERTLLAREIHDELGQILVALKIDMGMLKQKVLKSTDLIKTVEISENFDAISLLVDNTIKTARRIMNGLRPQMLELMGFIDSAKMYCNDFNERYNIKCQFESGIDNLVLKPQQTVALFRVLQETLANVARHSMATEVKVNVNKIEKNVILEIIDNGIGFSDSIKVKNDSYGLIGMKERAVLLEAEIQIEGNLGKGASICLKMPC